MAHRRRCFLDSTFRFASFFSSISTGWYPLPFVSSSFASLHLSRCRPWLLVPPFLLRLRSSFKLVFLEGFASFFLAFFGAFAKHSFSPTHSFLFVPLRGRSSLSPVRFSSTRIHITLFSFSSLATSCNSQISISSVFSRPSYADLQVLSFFDKLYPRFTTRNRGKNINKMKRFSSRFLTLLLVLLSIGAFDLNILLSSFRGSDHGPISTSAWHSVSAAPLPSSMGDIDVLNSNLQARSRNPRVGVVVKPGSSFKVGSGKGSPAQINTLDESAPASSSQSDQDAASSASSYTTATSSSSSSAFENADGRVGMKVQLKRLERNPNANPLMLYQRHLNRANAKLASILGRRAPSQADMDRALQRRRSSILSKRDTASLLADNRKFTHPRQGYTTHRESGSELQRRLFGSMLDGLFGRPSDDDTDEQSQKKGDRSAASAAADPADGYPEASVNASMSDNLIAASDPTAVQSLGLDIEANDIGYVATIQIGSQDTSFRMLIDSGSADTWVPSSSCADCGSTHQKLGRDVSSTFVASNTPFSIQYGTGSVSGNLATDDLEIAGLDLTNYTFAVTTEESSDFSDPTVPFDGLMGLAKSELSNAGQPTPIDALYAEDKVQAPVMGYHLGRVADGYNDGEVTFGGVDAAKYQGSLTEIPNVSDSGFWEAAIDAINVGGDDLGLSGRTAILDTGTTLIVAPESDADAIHAAIPGSAADGQGGYTIPCTTSAQVTFTFGGTAFPIDTRDLLFLPLDENDLTGDCVSAISAGDVGQRNQWLLGATFLKNVYFATNSQADAIGLGMLATENSTSNGTDTDGN